MIRVFLIAATLASTILSSPNLQAQPPELPAQHTLAVFKLAELQTASDEANHALSTYAQAAIRFIIDVTIAESNGFNGPDTSDLQANLDEYRDTVILIGQGKANGQQALTTGVNFWFSGNFEPALSLFAEVADLAEEFTFAADALIGVLEQADAALSTRRELFEQQYADYLASII